MGLFETLQQGFEGPQMINSNHITGPIKLLKKRVITNL